MKTQGTERTSLGPPPPSPAEFITACSLQGHTISHPSLYPDGLERVPASLLALQMGVWPPWPPALSQGSGTLQARPITNPIRSP